LISSSSIPLQIPTTKCNANVNEWYDLTGLHPDTFPLNPKLLKRHELNPNDDNDNDNNNRDDDDFESRYILPKITLNRNAISSTSKSTKRPQFTATLKILPPKSNGQLYVFIQVTNTLNEPIRILRWWTPWGRSIENIFNVTNPDGTPSKFLGYFIKRQNPDDDEYIPFHPHETKTIIMELTHRYEFIQTGMYHIQLQSSLFDYIFGPLTIPCGEKPLHTLKQDHTPISSPSISFFYDGAKYLYANNISSEVSSLVSNTPSAVFQKRNILDTVRSWLLPR